MLLLGGRSSGPPPHGLAEPHRVRLTRRAGAPLRCLTLLLLPLPALAAGSVRHFDIPPENAALALNQFAREADVTLLFSSSLVSGSRMAGLHGDFSVTAGLARLLGGTGLSYRQVGHSAIAIVKSPGTPGAAQWNAAQAAPGSSPSGRSASRPRRPEERGRRHGFLGRIAGLLSRAGTVLAGGQGPVPRLSSHASANSNSLQEVVVTGTPEESGVKLLDASFAITTASLTQIHQALPSSAADLLKIVPGLWAESTGGKTGPNIELAGFPGGADAPYVTYQIEGSPIYPAPTLSFMDNSSLFRLDDTIERVEIVQGGPSVVYSNGQIGATANFILRHGTARPHGELALTIGSEGKYRLDGFFGGPLAPRWFVSVGGFYRESNGIRSPQFPADQGGQITATLLHTWAGGRLLFWGRELDDKNLFVTDIPLAVSANGRHVSAFPGFDPHTGTFAGNATRGITVEEFPCAPAGCTPGTLSADLADGRGSRVHFFGSDLHLAAGAWTISNNLGYTAGEMPTNALFNNFAPETLGSFVANAIASANADPYIMGSRGTRGVPFTSATASFVTSGIAANPATEVASLGFWIVRKRIQAFTDDLRFSRRLFAGDIATLGGYFADYSSDDTWYLGNNELMTATPNAQLINVSLYSAAGAAGPVGQVTQNGILSGAFYALEDRYTGRNTALFFSDQWHVGPWLLDAEYRAENENVDGIVEGSTSIDLDANPLTLYNNGTNVVTGRWSPSSYDHTLGAWSAGVNYQLRSSMSVYARVNEGVHFPSFDDLRNGAPDSQRIQNYELGFRSQSSSLYASVDFFHRVFYGVPFQAFLGNGAQVTATYGARSFGTDVQLDWFPLAHLSIGLTGDWQHSLYTHFSSYAGIGGTGAFDNNGHILQRQPRLQFRITPEYDVPTDWGELKVFSTVSYIDLRYSDPGSTQVLPAYYTLDAGIVADIAPRFEVRLQGTNLTDEIGLTEGNARALTSGISAGYEMARPIFGREVQAQLKYLF